MGALQSVRTLSRHSEGVERLGGLQSVGRAIRGANRRQTVESGAGQEPGKLLVLVRPLASLWYTHLKRGLERPSSTTDTSILDSCAAVRTRTDSPVHPR